MTVVAANTLRRGLTRSCGCYSNEVKSKREILQFHNEVIGKQNVFINCDCMEALRLMPNKCVDLAICDPPYGIGADEGTGKYGKLKIARAGKTDWDAAPPPPEYFKELFRVSKNQIIFGGNYFFLPPSRGFIVWDKGEGFYNRDFAECEFAWTSFDANARIFKRDPLALRDYIGKIHPTQKPVALYEWILTRYARDGDIILDTHVGSASSLIACHNTGHKFVGFELDTDYYTAAKARLEAVQAQTSLFDMAVNA